MLTRAARHAVVLLLAALVALAPRCASGPPRATRGAVGGISLLAAVSRGEAHFDDSASGDGAVVAPIPAVTMEFDGEEIPPEVTSGASLLAAGRGEKPPPAIGPAIGIVPTRDPRDDAPALGVTAAAAGLVRDFSLAASASARVRARVRRAQDPDPSSSVGAALQINLLDRYVGSGPGVSARNHKLNVRPLIRDGAVLEAPLQPGCEWQELELVVKPFPGREGLRVLLFADEGGLLVDRLVVEPIEPWRAPLEAALDPDGVAPSPRRKCVRLGQEVEDSLVLAAGARATFAVEVPRARPRLELDVGAIADPARSPTLPGLIVRAAGRELGRLAPPARGFAPATLALDGVAGREIELELEAVGGPASFLFVGDPRVLGAPESPPPPSLVLVSIDTLRADRVGCYGRSPRSPSFTPNLDRLAAQGTRCARVVAASTWTLPSHAALFTGQFPELHGAVDLAHRLDARRSPPLALELADAGYATAAFTGGGVMDSAFGFGAGFGGYSTRDPGFPPNEGQDPSDGRDPLAPALDWLERRADQPFFLFLHTYLVHNYSPRREFVEQVAPGRADELLATPAAELVARLRQGDAAAAAVMRVLYDASVAQIDATLIGPLLAKLAALGLDERTLVVVLSDHGEEFLEHGGALHGDSTWRELHDVPWILRGPGVPAGRVVEEPVSHVDVLPTLLARLGRKAPPTALGVDVLERELSGRPLLIQLQSRRTGKWNVLYGAPWELVLRGEGGASDEGAKLQLFRVDEDRDERRDLAGTETARRAELARRLDHELAALRELARALDVSRSSDPALDPELIEKLRELGYVDDGDGR
jgi:arylsulfatase A-like enzyme